MKAVVVLCALVMAVSAHPHEKYTSKYDNTNFKEILNNDRLLTAYSNCLLGLGKCTPDAKELKSHITDALENRCSKCTEKQKEAVRYIIKHLINEKSDLWKKLCAKYDPSGKFSGEYEKELKTLK